MVLLLSGATPAAAGRLELLNRVLPSEVIEASHFLSSLAGAALLLLSQGLARRLDAAYYLTAVMIVTGMAGSLLKGFDYEEAVELSIDLMRYHRDAPKNIMEALLVHLLTWGKEQQYRRFDLGMAPLAGVEGSPVASLWSRLSAFLYEHGESIYHFQGLRAYKDKFHPIWEPHYLAYPGGLRLPRIMADVSALVAGGYGRVFRK